MATTKIGKHDLDSSLVLPIANGGTGASTAADARTNLGVAASSHNHNASNINAGTLGIDRLPTVTVAKGGTGATDAATARTNLGVMAKDNPVGTGTFSLNRKADTTTGIYSFASGFNTTASGEYSFATGHTTVASGNDAFASGYRTTASGIASHAECSNTIASAYASHAEGSGCDATADYAHAEGFITLANGIASHAEGHGTEANNYASSAIGKKNKTMTAGGASGNTVGDVLVIGNGTSDNEHSNAFRVTYAGKAYGLSSYGSTGADYAEFFEWEDGNNENEDRVGYFVTMNGNKIKKATTGDYILGIISGQPCIVGNSDEDWLGRWEHDAFGRFIKEDTVDTNERTGEVIRGWKYKANPEYDITKPYIPREERKEWDYVGMLGVLSVRDDGTCIVNGFCKVADGGIATKADKYIVGETYRVIERVTDNVVKVIFK